MKRSLIFALLLTLAACGQAPAPDAPVGLEAQFGTADYDRVLDLSKHSAGVYAAGQTYGSLHGGNGGDSDAFLRKYSGGDLIWGRQFGSPEFDTAVDVASDASNNAYVVGDTEDTLGRGNSRDVFLHKYTTYGAIAWTRRLVTADIDFAGSVAASGSSVYVVGTTGGSLAESKGGLDGFVRKYSAGGSVVWTRQFGTTDYDGAHGVAVDINGNVYVVGSYGSWSLSRMFVRKYNAGGALQWETIRDYPGNDDAVGVVVSGDSVYVVGTFDYNNNLNNTDYDVRVLKLTLSGAVVWDQGYGPAGYDYAEDIGVDGSGGVYVVGWTETSFAGANQGEQDGFVVKLNAAGTKIWGKQLGTPGFDSASAVEVQGSALYAAGNSDGSLGGTVNGWGDGFVMRLSPATGGTVWTD